MLKKNNKKLTEWLQKAEKLKKDEICLDYPCIFI